MWSTSTRVLAAARMYVRSGCTGSGETDINTMVALESGNESSVQNCYNNGLDSDHSRREAALMKFHMKRKDRCFGKIGI